MIAMILVMLEFPSIANIILQQKMHTNVCLNTANMSYWLEKECDVLMMFNSYAQRPSQSIMSTLANCILDCCFQQV